MIVFSVVTLLLAAVPALLFLQNLRAYLPPPAANGSRPVSVLIPARNEEHTIRTAVESVLENRDVSFEVIVMDDDSTDATATIVREMSATDLRVRLASAPSLPAGWNGKQHACQQLAMLAKNPVLLFMDADVRLAPDAITHAVAFLDASGAALVSGVPRQEFSCSLDRLLVPLIHFILLGFLPIQRMRESTAPAYAAGCGQLFVADAEAYRRAGGHAAIRGSAHDGIALPRAFRRAGFHTDLFDATGIASCRMYSSSHATWEGLAKNATEGMAAPVRIVPWTLLLLGGHVLPFVLLAVFPGAFTGAAVLLSLLPRMIAVVKFRQPLVSAVLHPIGVTVLIAIQWFAFFRALSGRPALWKGRSHFAPASSAN